MTLPRGREETMKSWYANARQGVHVCGLYVWGAGFATPTMFFYVSRCQKKGSLYSLSVFRHWMERADLSQTRKLQIWSDGGPHFRCNRSISTLSIKGLEAIMKAHGDHDNAKEKINFEVENSFGVPQHFKNECDG